MNSGKPLPFSLPAEYLPLPSLEGEADSPALWFVFQGASLVLWDRGEGATLMKATTVEELGFSLLRRQYLGQLAGEHCFAGEIESEAPLPPGAIRLGLREVFGRVDDNAFALAGRALQVVSWDRTHQFCGACGTPTKPKQAERARECPQCGLVAYPRIAPAIMALVRRGRELLLARSPHFPPGMYSALAGFVDPGESLEGTLAREVFEEVGLRVRDIEYFGSQPWPFPNSLMIAFTAHYESGELTPDRQEIEDAQWFDLEHLPTLPGKISISRRLIDNVIEAMRGEHV
jgi:NAD+ diphosphatase